PRSRRARARGPARTRESLPWLPSELPGASESLILGPRGRRDRDLGLERRGVGLRAVAAAHGEDLGALVGELADVADEVERARARSAARVAPHGHRVLALGALHVRVVVLPLVAPRVVRRRAARGADELLVGREALAARAREGARLERGDAGDGVLLAALRKAVR